MTTTYRSWAPSTDRRGEEGRTRLPDVGEIRAELSVVADKLSALWSSAAERGDFDEITRLVDAGHAVHRALAALGADGPAPAWRTTGRPERS